MDLNYKETEKYWDNVFEEEKMYDPFTKLPYVKIEKAVQWLCLNSNSILDFGCGTGRVLSRCFDYGIDSIYGIDLSANAIKLARKIMEKHNLKENSNYICGDIESLHKINDNQYDGVILFNIIDNLKPEDGIKVIEEIHRILKTNGKVILKLNPYLSRQELDNKEFEKIATEFYKESSGLFLWNISNDLFIEVITPYFNIFKKDIIEFKEHNMTNRLYYLKKADKYN